jgi:hypothetical protein
MPAPELEVVEETVGEKQTGFFTKFIVLVLLPTIYAVGLGMLLLHFAGVNIHTQIETVENYTKPIMTKIDTPKKTAPPAEKQETTLNTNNESVPYSSKIEKENPSVSNSNGSTSNDSQVTEESTSVNTESIAENNSVTSSINNSVSEVPQENASTVITTTESSIQLYQNLKPEQIAAILKGIEDRQEVLTQIKKLEPKTAAKVIILLEPGIAGWLVTQMD